MHRPHLTLLSPARDKEVAKAAIQAGADAVYIGAPAFGARQAAGNSLDDLAEVVSYAHTYGVQVLVTLNTLLRDEEYPEAVALAHALYQIGVDALIIQDLHLLDFDLPPIRLHASTQCDNRTAEQAVRMQQLGFKRIVLARELSIDEIRAIRDAVAAYSAEHHEEPIELEAFVHGALCVSYSGRCYISEVLANRSANRGACAQYCRMAYDLLDSAMNEVPDNDGKPIHQRHLLSLQDMDRSAYLHELIDAGVTTFKIEGRLKDAAYVTNITAYYREKLDRFAQRGKTARDAGSKTKDERPIYDRSFEPNPEKTFHRGATDYFLHGRTRPMANWDTPKSTGEYVGEVIEAHGNTLRVRLIPGVTLHNGDGLTLGSYGFSVNGVEDNLVRINKDLSSIRPFAHSPLYRNLDTDFVKNLKSERRIPIDIVFRETQEGFELQYKALPSGKVWVGSFVYPHTEANNATRALDTIRTQLAKLGDTPYIAREIKLDTKPYFIPISILNEWRRSTVESQKTKDRPLDSKPLSTLNGSGLSTLSERGERSLMECKYCILHEAGHCRKTNPYPKDKEPRFLRLRNQTVLRLTFDCHNCQMLVDEAK